MQTMQTEKLGDMVAIGRKETSSVSSLPVAAENDVVEMVVFKLGEQPYGLGLERVVEIIRMIAITPVPESEAGIEGVINLRGEIVPVLDLRRNLNLETIPFTLSTQIIIVQVDGRKIGLVVDSVTKVTNVLEGAVMPSQQIAPNGKHLLGVAKTTDYLLLILDVNSISRQMREVLIDKVDAQENSLKSAKKPNIKLL